MPPELSPAPPGVGPAPRAVVPWLRGAMRGALPFLTVAALIAVRSPEALLRSEFWAEDATEFFFGALSLGPRALVTPVYGYHFFLERLIALGATFLPVFHAPYVYAWSCLLVDAAALSWVARDGFAWILPRRWQRILLAALLALGPGSADILLNLTNLPNPLCLLAFLLLVERPFRMTGPRLAAFALVAASSGHAILWLPVAAYLAWTQRSRGYAAAAGILVTVAVLDTLGADAASRAAGSLDYAAIAFVPRILVENAFARLILGPFLGLGLAARVGRETIDWVYWAMVLAGGAAFAFLAMRRALADRDGTVVLVLGCAESIGMLGLVAISRAYNVPLLVREQGNLLPDVRYSFLPAALATLTWSSWLLRPTASGRLVGPLRLGLAALVAVQLAWLAPLRFARPDLAWEDRAQYVQALIDEHRLTGREVVITMDDLAIHPVGWIPDNRRVAVRLPGR